MSTGKVAVAWLRHAAEVPSVGASNPKAPRAISDTATRAAP
ncbi:hypothetical protein [Georgenia yuyongxinii]|nr:hypothetical protein [Georgenia yuyongxinii]